MSAENKSPVHDYDPATVNQLIAAQTQAVLDKIAELEKSSRKSVMGLKFCDPGHCGR